MKLSIALLLMSAAVLAGCSRPVVRETVVERPVYVDRPVVVQPAAAGASAASCTFASQSYSHGALSCQDRTAFKCENGTWTRTLNAC
jgi:hypothetical protein